MRLESDYTIDELRGRAEGLRARGDQYLKAARDFDRLAEELVAAANNCDPAELPGPQGAALVAPPNAADALQQPPIPPAVNGADGKYTTPARAGM